MKLNSIMWDNLMEITKKGERVIPVISEYIKMYASYGL